jgi:hypothetical protein
MIINLGRSFLQILTNGTKVGVSRLQERLPCRRSNGTGWKSRLRLSVRGPLEAAAAGLSGRRTPIFC